MGCCRGAVARPRLSPDGELGAGPEAQFGQDILDVSFRGPLGDDQLAGGLLAAHAEADELGHLPLSWGQTSGSGPAPWGGAAVRRVGVVPDV